MKNLQQNLIKILCIYVRESESKRHMKRQSELNQETYTNETLTHTQRKTPGERETHTHTHTHKKTGMHTHTLEERKAHTQDTFMHTSEDTMSPKMIQITTELKLKFSSSFLYKSIILPIYMKIKILQDE